MNKALLIGNGPSVAEKEFGSRIDSNEFDKVIRFNRWRFDDDGSEHKTFNSLIKNVGTRCDYWVVSDQHVFGGQNCNAIEKKHLYEAVLVVMPKFKYVPSLGSLEYKRHNMIHNSGGKTESDFVKEIEGKFPNIRFIDYSYEDAVNKVVNFEPNWPSTGTTTICLAIDNFEEVYLHGFDCFDFKYDTIHYFEDENAPLGRNNYKFKKKPDHTPDKDKEYIKYVINNKNVKILK